jgi:wobble nucleotide-excising tRNase
LEKRKQKITDDFSLAHIENNTSEIDEIYNKFDNIRIQSNDHTNTLSKAKEEAQKSLRLHEVRTFVDVIDYDSLIRNIVSLHSDLEKAETSMALIQSDILKKQQAIEGKKRQLNDEEKGAQKVNEYLNHFFGHQFLTLMAIADENTEGKQIYFEIFRGKDKAFNLSEGECSLIAFCYFIAKLDDVNTSNKHPIIWIDDPVSSLDGNHIFFVYSLLRAKVIDKNMFEQLFISTHNLDFLKYLKRLTGKDAQGKDLEKTWLVVERTGDNSIIKVMPKYLKEYITEFNYLFHQIYKCAKATTPNDDNYVVFYSFGNNLRKFLDIYLYYKYPDGVSEKTSQFEKMSNIFGDKVAAFLTDRINNEHSHLSGVFERGAIPVDVPEMQTIAYYVLEKLKKNDIKQYDSFLKSIGEADIIKNAEYTHENVPEIKVEKSIKSFEENNRKNKKRKSLINYEKEGYLFEEELFKETENVD